MLGELDGVDEPTIEVLVVSDGTEPHQFGVVLSTDFQVKLPDYWGTSSDAKLSVKVFDDDGQLTREFALRLGDLFVASDQYITPDLLGNECHCVFMYLPRHQESKFSLQAGKYYKFEIRLELPPNTTLIDPLAFVLVRPGWKGRSG